MSETHALPEYHDESGLYEIRLKGHLDSRWSDRFEGLTITLEEDGDTLLSGPVAQFLSIAQQSDHKEAQTGGKIGEEHTQISVVLRSLHLQLDAELL